MVVCRGVYRLCRTNALPAVWRYWSEMSLANRFRLAYQLPEDLRQVWARQSEPPCSDAKYPAKFISPSTVQFYHHFKNKKVTPEQQS